MQKKMFIGLALTIIIIIFIAVYWAAESGRQEAARERQTAEAIERGAELYTSFCAVCHGPQGEGGVGPALRSSPLDDNVLERTIARGITGTAMPTFDKDEGGPLNEHQIKELVTFIKNWESHTSPTEPMSPPTPPPTGIDATKLYTDSCAVCHGPTRTESATVGPLLIPKNLADVSDDEIKDVILNSRPDTAMPKFKELLSDEEIEALLQFIKYDSP